MKRFAFIAFFVCVLVPSVRAAITVTAAASAGTNNSSTSGLVTGTYNQPAGNCVVAIANGFGKNANTPTDTAGDTFTLVLTFAGGNSNDIKAWIAYGSNGNVANAVTATYTGNVSYGTLTYYDVNPGGTCTSSLLDIASNATTVTTNTGSISQTITTAAANEAIISTVWNDNATLSSATAPSGFTAGGVVSAYSLTAYEIVSSIQSGVTLTWSSINPNQHDFDMITLSLKAATASTKVCTISLLGAGPC